MAFGKVTDFSKVYFRIKHNASAKIRMSTTSVYSGMMFVKFVVKIRQLCHHRVVTKWIHKKVNVQARKGNFILLKEKGEHYKPFKIFLL
jgi:hypothetical protein